MAGVLIIRGDFRYRYTHRKNATIRLEYSHEPRNYQKLGQRPGADPSTVPSEGVWSCRYLDI